MATVKMFPVVPASAPQQFQALNTGTTYTAASDGSITVDTRDVQAALSAGFSIVAYFQSTATFSPAPLAANANAQFSSAAASNGALAIAAQPDWPRQVQWVFFPGTSLTSAGQLTLIYNAVDGTVGQTDNFSIVTAASTNISGQASKGVVKMTSMSISGLVGGNSPAVQVGTTAVLAVPMPINPQDAVILGEQMNSAGTSAANVGTLTNPGLYTPHTAPNATNTYAVTYSVESWS